jgi:hypothetical protein
LTKAGPREFRAWGPPQLSARYRVEAAAASARKNGWRRAGRVSGATSLGGGLFDGNPPPPRLVGGRRPTFLDVRQQRNRRGLSPRAAPWVQAFHLPPSGQIHWGTWKARIYGHPGSGICTTAVRKAILERPVSCFFYCATLSGKAFPSKQR